MIGAIAGDVIGSVHEGSAPQSKAFPLFVPWSRFTDDSVLTVAVASAIRRGERLDRPLRDETLAFARQYGVPLCRETYEGC